MKKYKDHANEAINIPIEAKINIERMAMEQGLYAQVVKLRQNYFKFIAANKNKNEPNFKFQGQSTTSQSWFDIYFDWIKVNFITREPDLYKKLFHSHDDTQDTNTSKIFQVLIGN